MLRIAAGQFKRTILEGPPDAQTTRPITARAKESLFGLLRGWFDDATVLDLFAGVGAIGLEAISLGAREVVLIEMDPRIAAILQRNIAALGVADRAHIVRADAFGPAGLAQAPRDCDVVFVDPPYSLWTDPESRPRVIDLLERCREVMKERAFLVLRTPVPWADGLTVAGFDGPESHAYGLDMFVHLFAPALPPPPV